MTAPLQNPGAVVELAIAPVCTWCGSRCLNGGHHENPEVVVCSAACGEALARQLSLPRCEACGAIDESVEVRSDFDQQLCECCADELDEEYRIQAERDHQHYVQELRSSYWD